ncbi:TIGR02757 family protein [Halarcobacter mediterraneus]|uniref:TIGR02757 family protein n=1 Tax=Halarcobacter mediterraneus TaxID=2023153 RepID=A0A4Q1B119_9BACT|nr:TIGR02757 family protein [Halarcobacter mediterraneus]RXK14021.1 TIGR02757 family protein [Halarcobacter mediterraneus]
MQNIKELLDKEVCNRNSNCELSYEKPDPLLVASRYKDEYAILLCALFGYGKASLIVKFLDSLNFDLLNEKEEIIDKELDNFYYRFQNTEDVKTIFKTFRRMKQENSLNDIFLEGYKKENDVLEGLDTILSKIFKASNYSSQGFTFLVSSQLKRDKQGKIKYIGNAPYKRWMMFLRWMVRDDNLDLGLWKDIDKKDLILPLDTHTFKVSQKLGLLNRKTYDLKSAVLITEKLKEFDFHDPIKYDFALYRIGQEKKL